MKLTLTQQTQIRRAQSEAGHYADVAAAKLESDDAPKPALYRGIGADGRLLVETLGNEPIAVGRSLTNGAIARDSAIELSGGFVDARPAPRAVEPIRLPGHTVNEHIGVVYLEFVEVDEIFYQGPYPPNLPFPTHASRINIWFFGLGQKKLIASPVLLDYNTFGLQGFLQYRRVNIYATPVKSGVVIDLVYHDFFRPFTGGGEQEIVWEKVSVNTKQTTTWRDPGISEAIEYAHILLAAQRFQTSLHLFRTVQSGPAFWGFERLRSTLQWNAMSFVTEPANAVPFQRTYWTDEARVVIPYSEDIDNADSSEQLSLLNKRHRWDVQIFRPEDSPYDPEDVDRTSKARSRALKLDNAIVSVPEPEGARWEWDFTRYKILFVFPIPK